MTGGRRGAVTAGRLADPGDAPRQAGPLRDQELVTCALWAATAASSSCFSTPDITAALAVVAEVLDQAPGYSYALAQRGALHLLAARAADSPAARQDAAGRAVAALTDALQRNVYLHHQYRPLLRQAEQLAAQDIARTDIASP